MSEVRAHSCMTLVCNRLIVLTGGYNDQIYQTIHKVMIQLPETWKLKSIHLINKSSWLCSKHQIYIYIYIVEESS